MTGEMRHLTRPGRLYTEPDGTVSLSPYETETIGRCDVCGIWTRDPHNPHDRGCPEQGDCICDHVVCAGCCWAVGCKPVPVRPQEAS